MRVFPRRRNVVAITTVIPLILVVYYLLPHDVNAAVSQSDPTAEEPLGTWDDHPVVQLHRSAQTQFDALLRRQSRSPEEAEVEYQRRYGRRPPPGFHRWAEYAIANDSPIVDDFDIIAEGVRPFLRYSADEVDQRIQLAVETSMGNHVGVCEFSKRQFGPGCRSWAGPLTRLLGGARALVPEVKLLLNFLDEPSVLPTAEGIASWTDLSHGSIAVPVGEACRAQGQDTDSPPTEGTGQLGIHFVQNNTAQRNLCQHPEYAHQHGFIMCPATFRRWSSQVPMLSRAAPHPFSDILYPPTHYSLSSSLYSSWSDRRWSRKRNAVYWTGSSTGGEWSHDTWRSGHRQRLVALAQGKAYRNFTFLRGGVGHDPSEVVQPYTKSTIDTSLFDVALTRAVGCASPAVCEEQTQFLGVRRRVEAESRPLRYRFALDIDGNSFSGRFYRLLASRSVPLKATIFREWHDERLFPWLHYVPVSMDLGELPELVRFLAGTAEGQRISREVAEAGRKWYALAIAPKHQGIYLYRLMLELAWLQNKSRKVE